jgi:hypothetical protein
MGSRVGWKFLSMNVVFLLPKVNRGMRITYSGGLLFRRLVVSATVWVATRLAVC